MRAHRIFHGLAFLAAVALPVAQGCSGDDASVNGDTSDGGNDGSNTGNDGSTSSDGNTSADTGSSDAFCAAANDYVTRCALTDSCSLAIAAACSSTEANASPQFLAAYEGCESMQPCPTPGGSSDGGAAAYDSCLASHFGSPDTVAEQLASDFCSKCLPASGSCSTAFYSAPKAQRLLELDDAILTEIDDTCISSDAGTDDAGPGTCADRFDACARNIVLAHDPIPAACNDR